MTNELLNKISELREQQQHFALAVIVNRKVPSSGKPGDKAVILADGTVHGWIGGGCTRGIVIKEAIESIGDGKSRLVRISPAVSASADSGTKVYRMTCHSGGMVEIYIEPVMPRPHLIIKGKSHIAKALCALASSMDYCVTVATSGADRIMFPGADRILEDHGDQLKIEAHDCIVVCTQGENDELTLLQAARSSADYVAFVASRKKGNAVFNFLRQNDVSFERLKTIKTPAGLDIGAKTPHEVAISILAEIIRHRNTKNEEVVADSVAFPSLNPGIYINPVCGVPVEKAMAKHVVEYKGDSVYFCCDGCKVQFEAQPAKYMTGTP